MKWQGDFFMYTKINIRSTNVGLALSFDDFTRTGNAPPWLALLLQEEQWTRS
jgi:hypothetical protein